MNGHLVHHLFLLLPRLFIATLLDLRSNTNGALTTIVLRSRISFLTAGVTVLLFDFSFLF